MLKACHLSYAVLVDVEAAQLTLSFKSTDLGETIALEVQGLQVGEELHTSQLIETYMRKGFSLIREISNLAP